MDGATLPFLQHMSCTSFFNLMALHLGHVITTVEAAICIDERPNIGVGNPLVSKEDVCIGVCCVVVRA